MPNKPLKILIRKDGQMFKEIDFVQDEIILGRSKEADVQLFNEDVSRKHVKIFRKGPKIYIEDLKSKNGTILAGQLIQKVQISPGDTFFIGPFNVSVEDLMPSEQRTVVEYISKSELETKAFHEVSKNTNTRNSIKDMDDDDANEEKVDRDSFMDAIAVTPEKSDPSFSLASKSSLESEISRKIKESKLGSAPKTEPIQPLKKTKSSVKDPSEFNKDEGSGPSFSVSDDETFEETDLPEHDGSKTIVELDSDEPFEKKSARASRKKPQKEQPESATELRKDFPSASDNQEISSEQFFLNRDIDDAGIPETFENFPETNKIKPTEQLSSFSQATQGEIEEKEGLHSDSVTPVPLSNPESKAISTDSFSTSETVAGPPDEDQIKTFMFAQKDLPASILTEETDEYSIHRQSRIRQFLKTLKPRIQVWMEKPRNRKILFVTSAVILGLGLLFATEGDLLFHREPVNPEEAINSEYGFQKLRRGEKKRVILFQIDKVQKLINDRQIEEADERMRKLMVLASKDEDFVKFEKQYQNQREAILAEENKRKRELQEKEQKKQQLLSEAQEMITDKQYDLAKKNYMHVLDLFPDDPDVLEKIQTLELIQEQDERQAFAKKQRYDMLSRIYQEGVQKYESGQPGVAQKLFKQVATEKGHPKYKDALNYLSKIENMTDKKVDQKIAKARQLIQSPDTLIQGYQELKKLSSQFPLRTDAKKYFTEAKTKMDKKARELYADALAQEELAGDPAAALDLYKEVLKYAPDPSNKYNQKAREKIESLQL